MGLDWDAMPPDVKKKLAGMSKDVAGFVQKEKEEQKKEINEIIARSNKLREKLRAKRNAPIKRIKWLRK